jgi:ribosomal protein S12 methylthiotransferase accessory factor YcaO
MNPFGRADLSSSGKQSTRGAPFGLTDASQSSEVFEVWSLILVKDDALALRQTVSSVGCHSSVGTAAIGAVFIRSKVRVNDG